MDHINIGNKYTEFHVWMGVQMDSISMTNLSLENSRAYEAQLLALAMFDKQNLDHAIDLVDPAAFTTLEFRLVFEAMTDFWGTE